MNILHVTCILIFCGRSWSQEQTYVIAAPKLFRVGASEKVVIQAFGYTEAFDATISLKSYPDKRTSYSSGNVHLSPGNQFQDSATLTIQPKDLSEERDQVSHIYLEVVSHHFTKEKRIPISYENGFLFIQTDKFIYTPNQSVKVRLYSLNEELKPALRDTTLTFVDPDGAEVEILEEKDFTGIVSFPDFKIPLNPKYGVWTIKAKYKTDFITTATKTFEIKEYVMPHFSISIEPENTFISYKEFEEFKITIKASYFYNKKVAEAEVFIHFGIIEDIEQSEKKMMRRAFQETLMTNGVAQVTLNSKTALQELELRSLEEVDKAYLYIAVTVLESSGGFSEEAEFVGVRYVLSPYSLNLVATPLFLKPGMTFPIKVQVKDSQDQHVGGVLVNLKASIIHENQEESSQEPMKSISNQNDGVASFVVNLPSDAEALEFSVKTEDPHIPEENQALKEYRAVAYSSLSQSYCYIDWPDSNKVLLVNDHMSITVQPRSPYIDKITHYSYLVLSKGKIVHFGIVRKHEDSSFQSLSIPVTQNMVPSARLLVYYIITGEEKAELVADSVWLNVEEKCGNKLEVYLSNPESSYKPGKVLYLNMKTQFSSYAALSIMDKAIYGVQRKIKKPMEKLLRNLEKSDLGCGAGGGQNNANVFHLAGLTFLTNANADDSREEEKPCQEVLRPKRCLQLKEKIEKKASTYQKVFYQCCERGAYKINESCSIRASRVTSKRGVKCGQIFKECCELATKMRANCTHKRTVLGRVGFETLLEVDKPEIRSYFPESWLWEVHHVNTRSKVPLTLPDSLTTWEVQGIGISNKGVCVPDPLQIQVVKDIFLEMHIPYSVVRGEQIEMKGTVYNYRSSGIRFSVQMSAGEGICLSGSSSQGPEGIKRTRSQWQNIEGSSIKSVTFSILPLELGLHGINFTLQSPFGSEILVKTLRVVPEGVKRETHVGFTLDPQGVYGSIASRKEFQYKIPLDVVPKTKVKRAVSVKGTLIGEVISAVLSPEGIDVLSNLPKGSAEAELMSIVPVFYVFHYLETENNWYILGSKAVSERDNMKRKMKEGIISILSYRNNDYSYKMWKNEETNTWLTAFALRILGQINKYIPQNQNQICNSLLWLIENRQSADGSFKEHSTYIPFKLQGTLPQEAKEKALYLTAFSVIGIRKSFHICPTQKIDEALSRAEEYLFNSIKNAQSTFTLAISAYALALGDLNNPGVRSVFSQLKKEAYVKGDPPLHRFWKDTLQKKDSSMPTSATAQIVETTAYALLASLLLGEVNYVKPIIKWLSEEQRYGGGFFSTQDTVNALEALTEYSLLTKRLQLNMDIKVAYKNKGVFHNYKVTNEHSLGRSVEVLLDDDLVVSTGFSNGLATVLVKTVFHKIGTSEEVCSFELKIEVKDSHGDSQPFHKYSESETKRVLACARYKPNPREPYSESSHAVMDIALPTGIGAYTEDLALLTDGIDNLLTDYQIKDGHVILQLDSIPSNELLCVRFQIFEIFHVGHLSPATFTVYEYHTPDKQCTVFYDPFGNSQLDKVCEGTACKCVEAECGQMQKEFDLTISANARKATACQKDIAYVYKVKILSLTKENSFVKYTATLLDIYKTGRSFAQKDSQITFLKKASCTNVDIKKQKQYLIMGKEALQIKSGFSFKFIYPLDSLTWIEYWPSSEDCSHCQNVRAALEEFSDDLFFSGCDDI
ncbi:complement C5 [Tachyglossus aculeatus]|uniref:complement C5 n=1 Tax=Tachyglossus aculeatus TaxID=9261 RepID=UPI0018F4C4C5|nr:complement C5 [Tachyglossus aculeatus]